MYHAQVTSIGLHGIPIITLLRSLVIDHSITAFLGDTGECAAITVDRIPIITLFRCDNHAVTTDRGTDIGTRTGAGVTVLNRARGGTTVIGNMIAVITVLARLLGPITTALRYTCTGASVIRRRIPIIAFLRAFDRAIAASVSTGVIVRLVLRACSVVIAEAAIIRRAMVSLRLGGIGAGGRCAGAVVDDVARAAAGVADGG